MEIIEKKKYNQEFGRLAKLDTITKGDLRVMRQVSRKYPERSTEITKPPNHPLNRT